MMAAIPELYPEELLFSFCSRYHQRMGYRSRESTARDLVGKAMAKTAIDFPCNLNRLAEGCSWTRWTTAEQLIDWHTLVPFYSRFVPLGRLTQIQGDMKGSRGGAIHGRIGSLTHNTLDQNLRFCPLCVNHDRAAFEETYWHRLHQLPGIDVCPKHRVFLEETNIHPRRRSRSSSFVTAEQAISTVSIRRLEKSNADHEAYLRLAQDAQWLLDHPNFAKNDDVEELYSRWFYARGFSWYSGQIKVTFLCEQIKGHYSSALLERFNCSTDRWNNWVRKLIHERDKAHHPVEHLLMIQFLGLTAEHFFDPPSLQSPFGDGPWPCLNPTCKHFRQRVITEHKLISSKQGKNSTAVFSCECGLIYCRNDRGSSAKDHYQATEFVTVTNSWLNRLKEQKESLPNLELARYFCTSHKTVLNLLFRSDFISTGTATSTSEQLFRVDFVNRNKKSTTRTNLREIWLKRRAENPDLSRSLLRKEYPFVANWLAMHDRSWFEKHLPPSRKQTGPPPRIDWTKQDLQLAQSVREQARRLRSAPGRPIRISSTSLATEIGKLAVVTKRGHLVPLTKQALIDVSETAEDYAVRRVNWASKTLRAEGIRPSRQQVRYKAMLSDKMAKQPLVQEAIERGVGSATATKLGEQ